MYTYMYVYMFVLILVLFYHIILPGLAATWSSSFRTRRGRNARSNFRTTRCGCRSLAATWSSSFLTCHGRNARSNSRTTRRGLISYYSILY